MGVTSKLKEEISDQEKWIASIVKRLRWAITRRAFVSLRIDIFDGKITRAELTRSVKDPGDIAPGEDEPLG